MHNSSPYILRKKLFDPHVQRVCATWLILYLHLGFLFVILPLSLICRVFLQVSQNKIIQNLFGHHIRLLQKSELAQFFLHRRLLPRRGSQYIIASYKHQAYKSKLGENKGWGGHNFRYCTASTTSTETLRRRTSSKDLQRPSEDDLLGLYLVVLQ